MTPARRGRGSGRGTGPLAHTLPGQFCSNCGTCVSAAPPAAPCLSTRRRHLKREVFHLTVQLCLRACGDVCAAGLPLPCSRKCTEHSGTC